MGQTNDRRTAAQKESTRVFVNATDKFMSGWGLASGGLSYYCVACDDMEQAARAEQWLRNRGEMKRVALADRPRRGAGSHTSICHFSDTRAADYE